ncbi:MAG: hypothetical protein JWM26_546 [Betaproteobacteria bacterium]|nr:hypothetical protein [Betaproteobacteria bacterium]
MRLLLLMCFALLVSLVGIRVAEFVVGTWVYERSGSATQFSLVFLFLIVPAIFLTPVGGVLADRWGRRALIVAANFASALTAAALAAVAMAGRLEVWHVYVSAFLIAAFSALQWPAFTASISLLVRKDQLTRANGLVLFVHSVAQIVAPILGGALALSITLQSVIAFELAALLVAVAVYACIALPMPVKREPGPASRVLPWSDFMFGWRYIRSRPSLQGLALFYIVNCFFTGIVTVLAIPMVLAFSSKAVLGAIMSISGVGMVLGSLYTGVRKRPANLIASLIVFQALAGAAILFAGVTVSVAVVMTATFCFFFSGAVVTSYYEAIWQEAVEPQVQGRVFSVRHSATMFSLLLAYIVAGPLADHVFEPLLVGGGRLSGSVGALIGSGIGRGIGLLFIVLGCSTILGACVAWLSSKLAELRGSHDGSLGGRIDVTGPA